MAGPNRFPPMLRTPHRVVKQYDRRGTAGLLRRFVESRWPPALLTLGNELHPIPIETTYPIRDCDTSSWIAASEREPCLGIVTCNVCSGAPGTASTSTINCSVPAVGWCNVFESLN